MTAADVRVGAATPAGRSPTWWPPTAASSRCRRRPTIPGAAVRDGRGELLGGRAARPSVLAHGTTVATNALLERRGATVALVTNEGFADVIEIARQDRPSLYDQSADRPAPLVPRRHRFEVRGPARRRPAPSSSRVDPADAGRPSPTTVEAVAVCLLHADLEPGPRAGRGGRAARRGATT